MRITTEERAPLWRRLLWFVGLWAASVVCITIVAFALRWVLKP